MLSLIVYEVYISEMSSNKIEIDPGSMWAAPTISGWDPGIESVAREGLPPLPVELQGSGSEIIRRTTNG